MLIDTFINAIFLYDDKMVITFNYKEGTTTLTFDDLKTALADQKTGSDLDCSTAPCNRLVQDFLILCGPFYIALSSGTILLKSGRIRRVRKRGGLIPANRPVSVRPATQAKPLPARFLWN